MSGWKFRRHHQRLAGWSIGVEAGFGGGAGWRSARLLGTLGHHYFSCLLTYDYPNEGAK